VSGLLSAAFYLLLLVHSDDIFFFTNRFSRTPHVDSVPDSKMPRFKKYSDSKETDEVEDEEVQEEFQLPDQETSSEEESEYEDEDEHSTAKPEFPALTQGTSDAMDCLLGLSKEQAKTTQS
jgi:hypothetical protein